MTTTKTKPRVNRKPKPGVYEGIPYVLYDAWPYVNYSNLKHALRSALHYEHALSRVNKYDSEALRFGRLVHAVSAGNGELDGIYIFSGPEWEAMKATYVRPTTTREWEHRVGKLRKQYPGREIYTADDMDQAAAVHNAIQQNDLASEYLRGARREVSIVWDDLATKLRCKARLDAVTGDGITDLKTTRDASSFEGDIRGYLYHVQLAFYRDGLAQAGPDGELLEARLIAAESSEPYGVRAARLSDELLEAGRELYETALARVQRAIESGHYPGYQNPDQWHFNVKEETTVLVDGREMTWTR